MLHSEGCCAVRARIRADRGGSGDSWPAGMRDGQSRGAGPQRLTVIGGHGLYA